MDEERRPEPDVEAPSVPPHPRRSRATMVVATVVAVVAAAGFAAAAVHVRNRNAASSEPRASGLPSTVSTPLATLMALSPVPDRPAPAFSLTDQNGRNYSLADFRGRSVVLEFMDPHCTDICPIISQEFVDAYKDLGADRSHVVFVAVNVNPYHLEVADVAAFTGAHSLDTIPSWHFLTGPVGSLAAVWKSYGVQVDAPNPTADVIHSSFVYFIDPAGHERYLGSPQDDHTAKGTAYLPADQIAAWGRGIALVVQSLRP